MNKMISLFAKLCACVIVMSIGIMFNAPFNYLIIFLGVGAGTYVVNDIKNYPHK